MMLLPADFHFLRPEWFYALIPLLVAVWFVKRWRAKATGWQGVIASHLYQHLITGKQQSVTSLFVPFLALTWLLGVIALAGPTWERIPQPVYQVKTGHVLVLDMSLSMRATDIAPDRLSRAKYKAIDLVNLIDEGDMGLVAYAGDAFVISPLTEDANTLNALLPGLSPEIMPVAGSDPVQGLRLAETLLTNAGFQNGMLYWITDGVEISQMKELSDFLSETPFKVNILGVGTEEGAPIKQLNGELLKRNNGSIVVPKLNAGALQQLSRQGGGTFAELTANDADIRQLSATGRFENRETEDNDNNNQGDEWREAGPYLLLLLLPIAAFAFKRGLIFALLVSVTLTLPTPPASAQQQEMPSAAESEETPQSDMPGLPWWKKPFLNANQQGLEAYNASQYDAASSNFEDPAWKGAAQYREGDYAAAAETYGQLDTADGYYNQGNALARAGQLDAAIAAYDKALEKRPTFPDAKDNKALIEKLKEQQDQQQQNQQNQQDQNQQDQSQQDQQQSDQQEGESGQDQQNSDQQNGQNQQDSQQNSQQDQQNADQQSEQEQQEGEQQDDQDAQSEEQQQQQGEQEEQQSQVQQGQQEQSERDKETQQRLNNLLRRVPDDPAFLLKRKMQLEAQKRQYRRPPDSTRSDW